MSRRFDGANDSVDFNLPAAVDIRGALTMAVVIRPRVVSGWQAFLTHHDSGGTARLTFEWSPGHKLHWAGRVGGTDYGGDSAATTTATTDWYLLAVTKTVTGQPRFHIKNLTTGAAWIHQNQATGTWPSVQVDSSAGGWIDIGEWQGSDDLNANMAVAAAWDVAMSDAQVEALDDNLRTSDFWNHAIGNPLYLWEFNQANAADSIPDLANNGATWQDTAGTSVEVTDPPSWTYDGTGAGSTHTSVSWRSSYALRARQVTSWQASYVLRARQTAQWQSSYTRRVRGLSGWLSSYVCRVRGAPVWVSSYVRAARAAVQWSSSYVFRVGVAAGWSSSYVRSERTALTWGFSYVARASLGGQWSSSFVRSERTAPTWGSSYVLRARGAAAWQSSYLIIEQGLVHETRAWASSYVATGRGVTGWTSAYARRERAVSAWQSSYVFREARGSAWQSSYVGRERVGRAWALSYNLRARGASGWASGYLRRAWVPVSWASSYGRVRPTVMWASGYARRGRVALSWGSSYGRGVPTEGWVVVPASGDPTIVIGGTDWVVAVLGRGEPGVVIGGVDRSEVLPG